MTYKKRNFGTPINVRDLPGRQPSFVIVDLSGTSGSGGGSSVYDDTQLKAASSSFAAYKVTGSTNFFTTNRLDSQGVLLNSSGNLIVSSSVGSIIAFSSSANFTNTDKSYHIASKNSDLILSSSTSMVSISGNLFVSGVLSASQITCAPMMLNLGTAAPLEGGQINFQGGAGGYDIWSVDVFNNYFRIFSDSGNASKVQLFNNGAGTVTLELEGILAGNQSTVSAGNLSITTTSHATKGNITVNKITIDETNSAIGIGQVPTAGIGIDISGSHNQSTVIPLQLRGGNDYNSFLGSQIVFGWNSTATFRHAIKTRHHNAQQQTNAFDFYVWNYGVDATGDVGTKHVMTMDGTGNVGINTTAPAISAKLDIAGTNGALVLPRLTNAQKDALTPLAGMMIYNTDSGSFCVYTTAWKLMTVS